MAIRERPTGAQVIAYDVGFGDCFLLRFRYPGRNRHVLIDFGSFPVPSWAPDYRLRVAQAIHDDCEGKLDAVVATHRHADHINGFELGVNGEKSGDVIRALRPEVVVQPWTEHPDADPQAVSAPEFARSPGAAAAARTYVAALRDMERVAGVARDAARAILREQKQSTIAKELGFLGEANLANASAVRNLMTMATTADGQRYVYFGADSGLERVLPGVRVRVLGPPTLAQSKAIQTQRQKDGQEFWHVRAAFWATAARVAAATAGGTAAAAGSGPAAQGVPGAQAPPNARWLVRKLKESRGRELLEIVRRMDDALNNTSVILLFQAGGRKLLFPGDAQYENWMYALGQEKVRRALRDVDFYKVGHHGSLNATPRQSLWDQFSRRSVNPQAERRLVTLVSTEGGHHGNPKRNTEVPREKLMKALHEESLCWSTEDAFAAAREKKLKATDPVRKLTVNLFGKFPS